MSADKNVNLLHKKLLLIGRTGNGKSSTGNSILGEKAFTASMNSQPFTEEDIVQATNTPEDTQITVVDGPGIGDASLTDPARVKETIKFTEKAIMFCTGGFDAVLLVLRYGVRFTREEKDAVDMVKEILGADVLKKHVVVVLTQGDNFETVLGEDGVSFEDWCLQQSGHFAELFEECKQRLVLFNNRTKDKHKLDQQRRKLLGEVKMCKPYTVQNYEDAEVYRSRLVVSSKRDIMHQKNKKLIDAIDADINQLDVTRNPDDAIEKLIELESKLTKHQHEIKEATAGTDVGKYLLDELSIVAYIVTSKKNLAESYRKLQAQATNEARTRGTQKRTSGKSSESGKAARTLPTPRDSPIDHNQIYRSSAEHSAGYSQKTTIPDNAKDVAKTTQPDQHDHTKPQHKKTRRRETRNHRTDDGCFVCTVL